MTKANQIEMQLKATHVECSCVFLCQSAVLVIHIWRMTLPMPLKPRGTLIHALPEAACGPSPVTAWSMCLMLFLESSVSIGTIIIHLMQ